MSQRYINSLFSLMPPGLFHFSESRTLGALITGIAVEFQNAQEFLAGRFANLFPQNSDERALLKWGSFTGQRSFDIKSLRGLVLRQLRKSGGATPLSFASHLEDLGISGEVERVSPTLSPPNCNDGCNAILWSESTAHAFGIRLPINRQEAHCNSDCNDPLVQNQTDEVFQYLRGAAPAHSELFFFYDSEELNG